MRFDFLVGVELERSEGRFASRDELRDQLTEALEEANPGDLMGENDGQYMVETWEVEEQAQPDPAEQRRNMAFRKARLRLGELLADTNPSDRTVTMPRKALETLALAPEPRATACSDGTPNKEAT